jgi:hypothetical protein
MGLMNGRQAWQGNIANGPAYMVAVSLQYTPGCISSYAVIDCEFVSYVPVIMLVFAPSVCASLEGKPLTAMLAWTTMLPLGFEVLLRAPAVGACCGRLTSSLKPARTRVTPRWAGKYATVI